MGVTTRLLRMATAACLCVTTLFVAVVTKSATILTMHIVNAMDSEKIKRLLYIYSLNFTKKNKDSRGNKRRNHGEHAEETCEN
jgi:hypothetical protein